MTRERIIDSGALNPEDEDFILSLRPKSLDEVDPRLLETYEKLGIPLEEQKALAGVAIDAVFDSVSVATTFRETLEQHGVIFCSFSDAVQGRLWRGRRAAETYFENQRDQAVRRHRTSLGQRFVLFRRRQRAPPAPCRRSRPSGRPDTPSSAPLRSF